MLQQHQRRRRPADQRHYFDSRNSPWLQIFADEIRERMRSIYERFREREVEDFVDQVEEAERLFEGFPKDWGNDWGDLDDDGPPYVGGIEI